MADDQIYPVINVEEEIGKTAGHRKPPRGLHLAGSKKVDSERSRKLTGGFGIPKGVYRFRSHEEASRDVIVRKIGGVPIPFASPRLLWRMKANTHRAKDAPDLVFLREYFKARGEEPPEV